MGGRVARVGGITERQRAALARLATVITPATYLAGGLAVSARCNHRTSIDLDLFTPDESLETILATLEAMDGVVITLRQPRTLYFEIDTVPASIITYSYPHLDLPEKVAGLPVPIAAVSDLVTMKMAAIVDRGARRDFWDLHELLARASLSLDDALALHRQRFPRHDLGHVIRALVYFADAEASPMPVGLTDEQWSKIRHDFERWVRAYSSS